MDAMGEDELESIDEPLLSCQEFFEMRWEW